MNDFDFDIYSIINNYLIIVIIGVTIALLIRICFAAKFGSAARDKGYGFASHFLLCLFFGTVGWISVCALPDKRSRKALERIAKSLTEKEKDDNNPET